MKIVLAILLLISIGTIHYAIVLGTKGPHPHNFYLGDTPR